MFDGSYSVERVGAQVIKMLKPDETVVCVTSDSATNMNAIEHNTVSNIAWFGCGCQNTAHTVQKLVLQPAVKASPTFSKAVAHLHKSTQSQKAFEQAQKVRLLHFARCRCWYIRCRKTSCSESAFFSLLTPSGRTVC